MNVPVWLCLSYRKGRVHGSPEATGRWGMVQWLRPGKMSVGWHWSSEPVTWTFPLRERTKVTKWSAPSGRYFQTLEGSYFSCNLWFSQCGQCFLISRVLVQGKQIGLRTEAWSKCKWLSRSMWCYESSMLWGRTVKRTHHPHKNP